MKNKTKALRNKSVLLGVCGGVAAYKSIDLARRLRDDGARVTVILTDAARKFVTPLSLEVASGNNVHSDLYENPLAHISIPGQSDVMVIAPATANTIGKLAQGIADDLISLSFLAFTGPVVIAPAMNWRMYEHPAFRKNLDTLLTLGVMAVGPERGPLACGEEGIGRMAEVADIVEAVKACLSEKDLAGESVIITAGPTREYIDPVRFLSNRSSGKMGYALARAALRRGAKVTLISGPSVVPPPKGARILPVETADDMRKAVREEIDSATIFIMAAAVADFAPAETSLEKIEKESVSLLKVTSTPYILAEIGARSEKPFTVGFAAETGQKIERAKRKLREKKVDLIVFNDVTEPGSGFDVDTNRVTLVDNRGESALPLLDKEEVADAVLDRIVALKA